jgi:hypothetical protein
MNPQAKYIQIISDLALPLFGYYFWDWNIYFILFFYVLDVLVSTGFTFVKTKKINSFRGTNEYPWKHIILIFSGYIISFYLVYFLIFLIYPATNLTLEIRNFLLHKELGLPQGVLLLPLLIYGGYMYYKMSFLMPRTFERVSVSSLWHEHLKLFLVIVGVIALLLGISTWVVFSDWVYVWGIVVGSTFYRNYHR